MARDRFKEEKDYEELLSVNSTAEIAKTKEVISKLIPGDIKIIAKNESQKKLINSIKNNEITICAGPAGTGKSYVAIAYALSLLRKPSNRFKKIYLVKSVTTLKGEEIGYIKGDLNEKIDPFMWSFYINIEKLILKSSIKSLKEEGILVPFPLAYMKGVSLDDCIVIADECVSGKNKIIIHDPDNDGKRKYIKVENLPYYFNKYKNLMVLSHNDKSNLTEWKKINSIRVTKDKKTINIKTRENKNNLIVTENHPFGIIENGNIKYIAASELKIGDRILKRKNKSDNHSILNEYNYDILLGFLLGDGCLQKNKQWDNNIFRLRKQHSLKQLEYNEFCANLYDVKCSNTGKSGFTGEIMSTFNTKSFYIENDFIKRLFTNGVKKRITADIEKYMSVRTLATWFMDDGSNNIYNEDGSNIRLHTEGFTKIENNILQIILKNKFNIIADIEITKKLRKDRIGDYSTYFNLILNKENSYKFQELIKEYVYPSMEYKLNKDYRGFYLHSNYFRYLNYFDITTSIIENISDGENIMVYNMEVEDNNNYFINDILTHNCQNVTYDNSRTLMTRIGSNSKFIILGDINQIDLRNKKDSSLETMLKMFIGVDNIGTIEMSEEDTNVRNPLITKIEEKYREFSRDSLNKSYKQLLVESIK
jgi:phosphate starvation-inducible protein PhoH